MRRFKDVPRHDNPRHEGTASFERASNTITLPGVVAALELEVGDVIRVSGASQGDNNKLFTVESIVNADAVIVNYEHRDGTGSLSLADESDQSGVMIERIAKWDNAPLGLGQAWVQLTDRRNVNTTYTNSTNRTIVVVTNSLTNSGLNDNYLDAMAGAIQGFSFNLQTGIRNMVLAIIPPGDTYRATMTNKTSWTELR